MQVPTDIISGIVSGTYRFEAEQRGLVKRLESKQGVGRQAGTQGLVGDVVSTLTVTLITSVQEYNKHIT